MAFDGLIVMESSAANNPDILQKEARAVTSSVVSVFCVGFAKSRIATKANS